MNEPQSSMNDPQSNQQAEIQPGQPAKEPLPTTPDPALVNITERGREPNPTRSEPGP